MNLFEQKFNRIKNLPQRHLEKDFEYHSFSFIFLILLSVAGFLIQWNLTPPGDPQEFIAIAAGVLLIGLSITALPMWMTALSWLVIAWIAMFAFLDTAFVPLFSAISLGILFSPCIQVISQWDKVVILRLGKFRTVHGPGLFFLMPLADRCTAFVDTRIRATDFSAEKTLTRDTVPVHVDALAFWMIWDAKQAILEVENFMEAVTLSAQTALRDSIGKHDLTTLLSERDVLCNEIQKILDEKTNPWGISILSVELTDIIIPSNLEDAMSKRAQAEREMQSRVILGSAEVEVAKKFETAAKSYTDNPTALNLRAMNMVYEGLRQKGSLILMPSSALDSMNLGSVLGTAAFDKIRRMADGTPETETSDIPKAPDGLQTTEDPQKQNPE